MQADGPIPGHIHLVIARKIGAPSPSPFQQGDNSNTDMFSFNSGDSSLQNENDNKEIFFGGDELRTSHNSFDTKNSPLGERTIEPVPPPRINRHKAMDGLDGGGKARNFLIDRLTGDSALRNESYTRATHESFNDSAMSPVEDPGGMRNMSYNLALGGTGNILSPGVSPFKPGNQSSPTVSPLVSNTVIIENDQQVRMDLFKIQLNWPCY